MQETFTPTPTPPFPHNSSTKSTPPNAPLPPYSLTFPPSHSPIHTSHSQTSSMPQTPTFPTSTTHSFVTFFLLSCGNSVSSKRSVEPAHSPLWRHCRTNWVMGFVQPDGWWRRGVLLLLVLGVVEGEGQGVGAGIFGSFFGS